MSKDLVLGKDENEARYKKEFLLKLEDDIFESLYKFIESNKDKLPLMWSLVKDYYEDDQFNPEQLKNLITEIQYLLDSEEVEEKFKCQLKDIMKICEGGISNGEVLFALAD